MSNQTTQRLIRQAKFKLQAAIHDIDYQHSRNIQKSQIAQLAQCQWIDHGKNLLVTGPCGSGKTYLTCAIGHQACLLEYTVKYTRLSRLLGELTQAKADGSYYKQIDQLSKVQLSIVDDWGLQALRTAERNDLMEIMDGRYARHAIAILSQRPTDQWYASIGDNTLADAILDRLMHNAYRLELKGESMRKRTAEGQAEIFWALLFCKSIENQGKSYSQPIDKYYWFRCERHTYQQSMNNFFVPH